LAKKNKLEGRDITNLLLLQILLSMTYKDGEEKLAFSYIMEGGISVCGRYFHKATGIPTKKIKMFEKYLKFCEGDEIESANEYTWFQRIRSLMRKRTSSTIWIKYICGITEYICG